MCARSRCARRRDAAARPNCDHSFGEMTEVDVRRAHPCEAEASKIIRSYMEDIVSRWHGRPATAEEVDEALEDEPATDLSEPDGYLAIAYVSDVPAGVGGVRFLENGIAELTKVFTVRDRRGNGIGSIVLDHLEQVARDAGCSSIRLDTRSDLHEACRMYERRGYLRVAAFSDVVYSDRWYRLDL